MALRPSIDQVRNLGMHASYYNWSVRWIQLPKAVSGFTSAELNTRALSISPPTKTQDEALIEVRGHKVYQHGIITYNPIELVLHETVDRKVGEFLESWMGDQWQTVSGIQTPKSLNQATLALDLLDSEDKKTATYTLVGVWPTTFDHGGSYDASNSDTIKYTVSLRYDYYKFNNQGGAILNILNNIL